MADELSQALDVQSELVASGGGVFEVTVDNDLVFSKRSLGRFPEPGEIVKLIQAR